jgi:hypothetical protein
VKAVKAAKEMLWGVLECRRRSVRRGCRSVRFASGILWCDVLWVRDEIGGGLGRGRIGGRAGG